MLPIVLSAALALAAFGQSASGDRVLKSESEANTLSFSKDGKSLAVYSRDNKIRVWNLQSGKVTRTIDRQQGEGAPVFLAAPGEFASTADGKAKIRDFESGSEVAGVDIPGPRVSRIASTGNGAALASASKDPNSTSANLVRVMDRSGKQRFQVPAGIGGLSTMTFSPDGETLVAAAYDTDVRVWSARNGELKRLIDEMSVSMFDLAYSPDGKYLAAAGVDRTIYLWDAKTWKVVRKITGQPETISAIDFSPDGKTIVTGGMNEMAFTAPVKVILWDVATGKQLHSWTAEHRVNTAAFSPDGKWVAVADGSKNVKVWAVPR